MTGPSNYGALAVACFSLKIVKGLGLVLFRPTVGDLTATLRPPVVDITCWS